MIQLVLKEESMKNIETRQIGWRMMVVFLVVGLMLSSTAMGDIVWLGHFDTSIMPDIGTCTLYTNTAATVTTGSKGFPFLATPKEALGFDGNNDHKLIYNFSPPELEGTFATWAKFDSIPNKYTLYVTARATDNWSDYFQLVMHDSDTIRVLTYNKPDGWYADVDLSTAISTNEWNHFTITWKNLPQQGTDHLSKHADLKVYLNGSLIETFLDKPIPHNRGVMYLGSSIGNGSGVTLDGLLDESTLWDTRLSDNEVQQMYDGMFIRGTIITIQ